MSLFRTSLQISANCRRMVSPLNKVLLRSVVFLKARNPRRFFALSAAVAIVQAGLPIPADIAKASTSLHHLIHQADHLYWSNKLEDLYELLYPYRESKQSELLWRFARVTFSLSQLKKTEYADRVRLITEGYEAAHHSLELDQKSAVVYKWASIMLDTYSGLQGFSERCKQVMTIKELMMKSAELDPTDPTVLYMLGVWYYEIADLAWYKRQILQAVGGVNPHATYEEALEYFENAEKVSPEFYSKNLLMLGKTYLKLGDEEKAKLYLQKAAEYPDFSEDDHRAKKEASAILAKLLGK